MLAHAQIAFLCFVYRERKRFNSSASMRTIAKRLGLGVPTSAPVMLAFLQIDLHRLFSCDLWISHALPSYHGVSRLAELIVNDHLLQMQSASRAINIRKFTQADNGFHRTIVSHCANETMRLMWESLKMQVQVIATLVKASMPLDKVYLLHPPIVDAFRSGSRDRASLLLKGHYKILSGYWDSLK